MFKHEKQLFHPVAVERPNPQYAALLQEQLGGGNGELKAAMQYLSQSFRIKDQKIKDLFLDIAAEELGHMEMVAQTINLLNGHDVDADQVKAGEIQSHVILGLNPGLINASGYSWTGDYVTVTGDLCADLLSNIASEQRAKVVYEYLYRQIDDKKVRETIDFLLNREEAHNQMFRDAFNEVQDRKCYRKTRRMKQSFGLYFFPGKGVRVMACKYLDFQDRKKIAKMYQEEARVLDIAYKIGCHPATIYEELRRGDTGKLDKNQRPEYDPRLAQRTFQEAIRRRGNRRTTTTAESGQ